MEIGTFTGTITIEIPTDGNASEGSLAFRISVPVKVTTGKQVLLTNVELGRTETFRIEKDPDNLGYETY
jgi:hypothetical protein